MTQTRIERGINSREWVYTPFVWNDISTTQFNKKSRYILFALIAQWLVFTHIWSFESSTWGISSDNWRYDRIAEQMSPFHDIVANVVMFSFCIQDNCLIHGFMHWFILIKFWIVSAVLLTALPVYDPWKMCLYLNFVLYAYKHINTQMNGQKM